MEEKIRENLKKFRDIPLSALISIMGALKKSFVDLERGERAEKPVEKPVEILIYNQDDRLNTAAILIKNGYTIEQGKRKRTSTGKSLDYFLKIKKNADAADTSR